MALTLRKLASFFSPKPQRARRSRSSTPESSGGRDPSVKGNSTVLLRLKSWLKRTKSMAPEGFFSVDVGPEHDKKVRYMVPITYLSHEDLQKLLDDSVAEFGHSSAGALQIACDEDEFQEVLDTIQRSFEGDPENETQRLIARKHA